MTVLQLSAFTGIIPRLSDTGLNNNQATVAENVRLQSGEIRPWKAPVAEYACQIHGAKSIFKLDVPGKNPIWCEWAGDTDVCYSPLSDVNESRIYYSEAVRNEQDLYDYICKKTNYTMAQDGSTGPCPRNWLYMGVPAPVSALELIPSNDSEDASDTQNVAYVYTYVSEFGGLEEESAPSPAAEVVATYDNYSVKVKGFADPPTDHLNVTKIRLYRVVTGNSSATYMEVDEFNLVDHKFPESGTSLNGVIWHNSEYIDTRTVAQLGKTLDSLYYTPPPAGLRGLVSMPNGFLAGFVNNEVWFSEPFLPHAWPVTYMMTVDAPIVGLGVYGNTLVVCTTGQPYTISGTHPSALTQEKQPMRQPCASKQSIAYDQYGVIYASPYGLVALAGGQMDVFTRQIITQAEWEEHTPSAMVAVMYNNIYMCSYRKLSDRKAFMFSRGDEPALTTYDMPISAMFVERATGRLYLLNADDQKVYRFDASAYKYQPYTWQSKRFFFPYWTNFSAMKVDANFDETELSRQWETERREVIEKNKAILESSTFFGVCNSVMANTPYAYANGTGLYPVPDEVDIRYVSVALIVDGKIKHTRNVTSCKDYRVPSFRGDSWQFMISGTLSVRSFSIGTTLREISSPG